ncbi:MAG: class I SAM-dependent methyltransferase [Burkholderiales bacterium]|nr:MAG: class I SAM-dependent methyltransferase [Burkholderiales bacterium]
MNQLDLPHPEADRWLAPWLATLAEHAKGAGILELGCGEGWDTQSLSQLGVPVSAIDQDATALDQARARAPGASYFLQDLRKPFPVADGSVGIVLASLSLHYFSWPETSELMANIHKALRPGGLLLCRLNSINDHNHGASGHPQIAENFYLVEGRPKRFFDQESLAALFATGWQMLSQTERVIHRYALPKAIWEIAAVKAA